MLMQYKQESSRDTLLHPRGLSVPHEGASRFKPDSLPNHRHKDDSHIAQLNEKSVSEI